MSKRATVSKRSVLREIPGAPVHRLPPELLRRQVRVLVVGCGGNGSEIVGGLPYLHQALLAWGHPAGINVLLLDGDVVSATNVVRQVFAPSDVGHHKATILVNRLNAFWGLNWRAFPRHLDLSSRKLGVDIVIGCVDSRRGRKTILDRIRKDDRVSYWLDLGNDASSGQFVLGTPCYAGKTSPSGHWVGARGGWSAFREDCLPSVSDLYPETIDAKLDRGDTLPSCSAQEALQRQEPFVNRVIAGHALAMLTRLFRYGQLDHHGGFVNIETGKMVPLPVSIEHWRRLIQPKASVAAGRIRPRRRVA